MTPGPDERRVIQRDIRRLDQRLRAFAAAAVAPPRMLNFRLVRRPKNRGFHACPDCGNQTRGTAKAGDERCAKCQQIG